MIKLVVGVGNPGPEYELTRHNIAWLVMSCMPSIENNNWKNKFKGEYTDATIDGEKVYFLKPMTYMNLSGESTQPLMHFFKIKPSELLVIHDEVDLPFGQIAFKTGGGLAGHNGLKSIAKCLGDQSFHRLRVGVGRPKHGSTADWVLGKFPAEQDQELGIVLEETAKAVSFALKSGIPKASNKFNRKDFLKID
tara:strand:- start:141992 stop:142570 length:579 start_codon:yes stop_codon:yes gene_type:complete